jgi:ribosomal protein S30
MSTTGRKGGRGTHGSLTKAGKVRAQTPVVEKSPKKKKTDPLRSYRKKYEERFLNG